MCNWARLQYDHTYIHAISRKAVINARRHDHQIMLLKLYPHPIIVPTAHIKIASPIQDIANLLVLVQMLVEEGLYFLLVDVAHLPGGDCNFISVLVAALGGKGIDGGAIRIVVVQDA